MAKKAAAVEVEEEREEEEQEAPAEQTIEERLAAACSAFGEDDQVRVMLFRTWPKQTREGVPCEGYQGELPLPLDLEQIREQFGGGSFTLRFQVNGRLNTKAKQFSFKIAGPAKILAAPKPEPAEEKAEKKDEEEASASIAEVQEYYERQLAEMRAQIAAAQRPVEAPKQDAAPAWLSGIVAVFGPLVPALLQKLTAPPPVPPPPPEHKMDPLTTLLLTNQLETMKANSPDKMAHKMFEMQTQASMQSSQLQAESMRSMMKQMMDAQAEITSARIDAAVSSMSGGEEEGVEKWAKIAVKAVETLQGMGVLKTGAAAAAPQPPQVIPMRPAAPRTAPALPAGRPTMAPAAPAPVSDAPSDVAKEAVTRFLGKTLGVMNMFLDPAAAFEGGLLDDFDALPDQFLSEAKAIICQQQVQPNAVVALFARYCTDTSLNQIVQNATTNEGSRKWLFDYIKVMREILMGEWDEEDDEEAAPEAGAGEETNGDGNPAAAAAAQS